MTTLLAIMEDTSKEYRNFAEKHTGKGSFSRSRRRRGQQL
jgi:hypothetical protein